MRRHGFGIFGLVFLGVYAVMLFGYGLSDENQMAASICMRVGFVLGAIWLAYPQLETIAQRVPPWVFGCLFLAVVILIIRPRYIIVLAPVLGAIAMLQFVGWLFKPLPQNKRPRKRAD